jgi:hypothetical protein
MIDGDSDESLGSEPGSNPPTQSGTPQNGWTNGGNALSSNGTYATAASAVSQSYGNFGFSVPSGNTITGVTVKLEAHGSTAGGDISVRLSWDGGSSVTSQKTTGTMTDSDAVYELGSASDLWGRSWTASEFNNGNFTIELVANPSGNTIGVDAVQVKVHHQTSGGGGGGGGSPEVSIPSNRFFASIHGAVRTFIAFVMGAIV